MRSNPINEMLDKAIKNDLASNGPMSKKLSSLFGLKRQPLSIDQLPETKTGNRDRSVHVHIHLEDHLVNPVHVHLHR